MNIILGVDSKERPKSVSAAAALLRRMRFAQASIDVVHVLTRMPYRSSDREIALAGDALEAVQHASLEWAQGLVDQIASQLRAGSVLVTDEESPLAVKVIVRRSRLAAGGLLAQAEKKNADLIAVDGPHQGEIGAFLSGSTARSLVIGSHGHSLLIAKDYDPARDASTQSTISTEPSSDENRFRPSRSTKFYVPSLDRPLRAVFATDHSPYSNKCVGSLIQMAPLGISHLTVLTATSNSDLYTIRSPRPDVKNDLEASSHEALIAENDAVLQKIAPLLVANGATGESRVIAGSANEAIFRTMEETKADLLILGAHGHGLMERLTLGSVSFHQAMTSPYSILILRA